MSLLYAAENLRQAYNGQTVLYVPSFRLEEGEAVVLQGPNGSGKSTFLRLLAFLEKPAGGQLRYFGRNEPRRACTLLLQEPWLMHATVFQNVILGLKLRGIHSNLRMKFEQSMRASGFEEPGDFAMRRPYELSGGEKQRVTLASRLILNPVVLLLDEPTAYVDSASAACIVKALRKARQEGTAIVCATHDSEIAKSMTARIMILARPGLGTEISATT